MQTPGRRRGRPHTPAPELRWHVAEQWPFKLPTKATRRHYQQTRAQRRAPRRATTQRGSKQHTRGLRGVRGDMALEQVAEGRVEAAVEPSAEAASAGAFDVVRM